MIQIHTQSHADRTIIELDGPFDLTTAPNIRKRCLKAARGRNVRRLEIDLSRASCEDTCCLAVLLEILATMRAREGQLKITGINEDIVRMISLSHLEEVFKEVIA